MFLQVSVRWKTFEANMTLERSHPGVLPLVDGEVHLGVVPLGAALKLAQVLVC